MNEKIINYNEYRLLEAGQGRGDWGHLGRPGKEGGSLPGTRPGYDAPGYTPAPPISQDLLDKQAEDIAKTGAFYGGQRGLGNASDLAKLAKLMRNLKDEYKIRVDEDGIRISDKHSED